MLTLPADSTYSCIQSPSHQHIYPFICQSTYLPINPTPPTPFNPSTHSPMHSLTHSRTHSITHPLKACCRPKANGVTYCEQGLLYVEHCNNNSRRTSNVVDGQVCGFKTQSRKSAKIAVNNIRSHGGRVNSRVFQGTLGNLIQVRKGINWSE